MTAPEGVNEDGEGFGERSEFEGTVVWQPVWKSISDLINEKGKVNATDEGRVRDD